MTGNSPAPAQIDLAAAQAGQDISPRAVRLMLAMFCAASLVLLAKQAAFFQVSTEDACSFYLPLAKYAAQGDWARAQHVVLPPLQSALAGVISRGLAWADDPQQAASQVLTALLLPVLILCIYGIASHWGRKVGLVAAAFTAVNPAVISYGAQVGPEMLYAMLLALTVLAMLKYAVRPSAAWAAAVGAASALAVLSRSEGLYLPLLAGAVVVVRGLADRRLKRSVLHLVLLVAVAAVIWAPRVAFVHSQTGWALLDIRILQHVPGVRVSGQLYRHPDALAILPAGPVKGIALGKRLGEALETLSMAPGPHVWLLGLAYLLLRRRLAARGRLQLIVAAVIACQIGITAPVKLGERYVMPIIGLLQVWAALGLVALATAVSQKHGPAAARKALALMLGGLVGALGAWSLLGTNAGTGHTELRSAGRHIRDTYDAADRDKPVVLASSSQGPYYSGGLAVIVPSHRPLSVEQLIELVDKHGVDFVVYRPGEDEFIAGLSSHPAAPRDRPLSWPPAAGPFGGQEDDDIAYVLPAEALLRWLRNP